MKRPQPDSQHGTPDAARVRLDKWLWAARFYRTRSLAAEAVEAGHVLLGGQRVKPSHVVRAAARLSVHKRELTWDVEVVHATDRRGSASVACELFRESPASVAAREQALESRRLARDQAPAPGRPTKRDRRRLEDFLSEP